MIPSDMRLSLTGINNNYYNIIKPAPGMGLNKNSNVNTSLKPVPLLQIVTPPENIAPKNL